MVMHLILTKVGNKQKSSRRKWLERLRSAGTYENFLKIPIEQKEDAMIMKNMNSKSKRDERTLKLAVSSSSSVSRQSPEVSLSKPGEMVRSTSSNDAASLASASTTTSSSSSSSNRRVAITRTKSFGSIASFFRQGSDDGGSSVGARSQSERPHGQEEDLTHNGTIDPVVSAELGERVAYMLVTTTERLADARRQAERCSNSETTTLTKEEEAWSRLKYLLSAVTKRNHLRLDNFLVDNAQSVNNTGRYALSNQSRQAIRAYYDQVQNGLDLLADGPTLKTVKQYLQPQLSSTKECEELQEDNKPVPLIPPASSPPSPQSSASWDSMQEQQQQQQPHQELYDRVRLLRKMKHNMGRTALMLSGGGAQAMYHIGVLRGMLQSKLYEDITVISGTSGGAITAAMCAIKTSEELYQQVCVPNVSTDFLGTGKQKKLNIHWFPTAMEMASYWFKNKLLMDINEFRRTAEFYYGDITFEEAFERTGKHVCISVSASRASADSALQRLLLNHISTPRVTLASAVAASCALPGVMAPTKLMTKNSVGELEFFEVDGVDWIDGSVQADIPFQRIATLFAVSNFIVSQTNFHIVPLLDKEYHPDRKSIYRQLLQTVEWDVRSRALKLSRLGLFPRIFGQDFSKSFEQKYHGNLTIVPRQTAAQTFGLKLLSNPTYEEMQAYIKYGEIATWPFLNAIRDMIRLEKVIDDCLNRLEHRLGNLNPEWYDDLESITSSNTHHHLRSLGSMNNPNIVSVSPAPPTSRVVKISCPGFSWPIPGRNGGAPGADTEKMRRRTKKLEEENRVLREKLQQLQQLVNSSGGAPVKMDATYIKTE